MPPESITVDKEKHMKRLKRRMECWREVILPLNSILLWDKKWYPGLILGITTTIFLFVWILEPTVLTIVSIVLLVAALVDYLVPILSSMLVPANSWTGQKEKKLNEICQNLAVCIVQAQGSWNSLLRARNSRPNLYYAAIFTCLLLLAWLGNTVNNLLLIYLAVNTLLLMPGLRHKGRARTVVKFLYDYATQRGKVS